MGRHRIEISELQAHRRQHQIRQAKKVKGRVPLAGPDRKKKHTNKERINSDARDVAQACQLHEDFKPLGWQGWQDYMKSVYDPDPQ